MRSIITFHLHRVWKFKLNRTSYFIDFTNPESKTVADGLNFINNSIEKIDSIDYNLCTKSCGCYNCKYMVINGYICKPCCMKVDKVNNVFIDTPAPPSFDQSILIGHVCDEIDERSQIDVYA